jgi:hypothetical protein
VISYKQQVKILSIVIKYLPPFIALMYFINSVLSLCDIYISAITFMCSCGFIPLLLIYVCCCVLKFCTNYKAYLAYIAVNNLLNWVDYIWNFTENILISWILLIGTFFILISYLMIKHIKMGKAVL